LAIALARKKASGRVEGTYGDVFGDRFVVDSGIDAETLRDSQKNDRQEVRKFL